MPRSCTICSSEKRADIDAAIAAGASYRHIASQFSVGYKSVQRHATDGHVAQSVKASQAAKDEASALNVVAQLKAMNGVALAILYEARRDKKNHMVALQAMDRVHRQIELQAKLLGDLDDRAQIDISIHPDWLDLQTVIIRALAPFPTARQAVAEAIEEAQRSGRLN